MNSFSSLASGLKKTGEGIGHGVGGVASGIGKGVGDVASGVGQGVGDLASGLGQGVGNVSSSVGQGVGNVTSSVGRGVGDVTSSVGLGRGVGDMTSSLGQGVGDVTSSLGRGVGDVASGLGKGVQGIGSTVEHTLTGGEASGQTHGDTAAKPISDPNDTSGPASGTAQPASHGGGIGGIFGTLTSGVTAGTSALLAPTGDALKSGATLARDATGAGFAIGTRVARSGLDMGADVAMGSVSLAGTALGGVVAAAAETSGAVFEPVGSGLKAIQGLDKLGQQGAEAINGLSLGAVRKISELTTKALNMSGKTPTFFDPDADGVVRVPDTVRGLVLLGLDEKNAKYAAYALHTVFSYPTSDSWIPSFNTSLPIHVAKMARTRWGQNWGNFERLEWVNDVEIDKFFVPQKTKKQWSDYWKQGRQGFGILLLIFEWGTTWPFYMPPGIPVLQIPFADDIGAVVRKAILPTIMSNFKKAHAADPDAKDTVPPSENTPTSSADA